MSRATRVSAFLVRHEPWLPLAIGAAWWCAMYPGLFGEDSLITLAEARDGPVTVLFTSWWIYVIRFLTIGTRAIPLVTLFGVLTLTFAVRQWAAACFPTGVVRALAVCLVCATPLVGALGIEVRHDVEMTAGLLLVVAVVTRAGAPDVRLSASDLLQLAFATLLVATRHNGVPTLVGAAIFALRFGGHARVRVASVFAIVSLCSIVLTQAATRAAGHSRAVDRFQSVEWTLTDISCLLSKDRVYVSADDWAVLTRMASPADWTQPAACRFMNKELFKAATFSRSAVAQNAVPLLRTWLSLATANPVQMTRAHAERVRLFLPPFVTGMPRRDNLPFIHSTIMANDFGLQWRFPRIAGTVRLFARAWNALALVVANAGLWLMALMAAVAWAVAGRKLRPTLMVAIALELGILVAAPMSEGRYGLFILICGHITTLVIVFEFLGRRLNARRATDRYGQHSYTT